MLTFGLHFTTANDGEQSLCLLYACYVLSVNVLPDAEKPGKNLLWGNQMVLTYTSPSTWFYCKNSGHKPSLSLTSSCFPFNHKQEGNSKKGDV